MSDDSGNVVAHYEYSPFGSLTKVTGDYAGNNPFRFSSDYYDEETGLVYYNYRYYNPELGRWISRDPIEEQGGYNLYGMIGNNPLLGCDKLGQGLHEWWCSIRDLWEKIKGAKEKGEEAARTIDNISTVADPNAPLDEKVKSVTDTAIDGAQKANRNNEANNIQNFQNNTKNNLIETQNLINKRDNELRKLYNGTW